MKRIQHHYAIVGDRPVDLLSPLLDAHFGVGKLRLLYPATARERANAIAAAACQHGREVEVLPLANARNTDALIRELTHWAGCHEPASAALNLSGVDPLYAIPARDAFRQCGHPVFAVEPNSDWLIWLSTVPGDYAPFNIADRLNIPDFLALHGLEWQGAQQTVRSPNRAWNQVALDIARKAPRMREDIAEINRLACSVNPELITEALSLRTDRPGLHDLVDRLVSGGIAERECDRLRFCGPEERAFTAGGWLEHRLFYAARPLVSSGHVQDLASGVRVIGPGQMAAEWDVVFLANNNLHIIECKARTAKKNGGGVGMEAFFKLESLSRLEGLDAYPMLATLARPTLAELARAAQFGIAILVLKDGGNLTSQLEKWIESISNTAR